MSTSQKIMVACLGTAVMLVLGCLAMLLFFDIISDESVFVSTFLATERTTTQQVKIVFSRITSEERTSEIYIMSADGRAQVNLTNHPSADGGPVCSGDGTQIAFTSDRDGTSELYVMNLDSTGLFQVTHTSGEVGCSSPSWSPDGQRIAIECDIEEPENYDIYVVNADGTELQRLTTNPDWDENPAWSPDGQHIAFESMRGKNMTDIYLMNTDGSGLAQVTDTPHNWDRDPAWSPDGRRIAFARMSGWPHGWQDADIYLVNADGTGLAQVTTGSDWDFSPSWSPDGTVLVFSFRPDDGLIYYVGTVNPDGTERMAFSALPESHNPSWCPSPDVSGAALKTTPDPDDTGYGEYITCSGEVMRRLNENVLLQIELGLSLLANDFTGAPGFCAELPKWTAQVSQLKEDHSDCSVPRSEYLKEHWLLRDVSLEEYGLAIECYCRSCPHLDASNLDRCGHHLDQASEYLNHADDVMQRYLLARD